MFWCSALASSALTTAYFLAKDGHEVEVIDRQNKAAMETSFSNAGMISPGHAYTWASPRATRFCLAIASDSATENSVGRQSVNRTWQPTAPAGSKSKGDGHRRELPSRSLGARKKVADFDIYGDGASGLALPFKRIHTLGQIEPLQT